MSLLRSDISKASKEMAYVSKLRNRSRITLALLVSQVLIFFMVSRSDSKGEVDLSISEQQKYKGPNRPPGWE